MSRRALLSAAFFLLSAACLLSACSPEVVYLTPPAANLAGGDVLPVEAQRIIDHATATGAALATVSARATAERLVTVQALQDARDVATLSAAQTQSAFDVALQAGQATQAAQSTLAVQTVSAAQTQAWATPTWAAQRTQAAAERAGIAASATAIAVASDRAQAGADAYRSLWAAAVAIAVLAMLVLAGIFIYWANERQRLRLATLAATEAEKVDRERLATEREQVALARMKLELMRDLMIERDGRPWLLMDDGRLAPMLPGDLTPVSHPNQARDWRWRAAAKKVVFCGIAMGAEKGSPQFGERDLAGAEPEKCWVVNQDGTPSSAGYRKIAGLLRKMGVWIVSGRDTVFAPAWTPERFEREFDHLPLPALPAGEPPEVRTPDRSSAVSAVSTVIPASAVPRSGQPADSTVLNS